MNKKEQKRNILVRQELLKQIFENLGLGSFFQLEPKDFIESTMPIGPNGRIVGELSYEEKIFYTIIEKRDQEIEKLNDSALEKLQTEGGNKHWEDELIAINNMENSRNIVSHILYSLLDKKYNSRSFVLKVVKGWKVQLTPSPNGEV